MNIEERMDRIEELYEKIYHDWELLSIYIPRLTDILTKYWEESSKYRTGQRSDAHGFRTFIKMMDADMQQHFKEQQHPKKKGTYSSYIYSSIKEEEIDEKSEPDSGLSRHKIARNITETP